MNLLNFENKPALGIGAYSIPEISKILNVKEHKIRRWIVDYWDGELGKEYGASYSWKSDNTTHVSFHTLIEFYIMVKFAEQGLSTRKVLSAHKELSNRFNTPFPFANKEVLEGLKTDGLFVFLKKGENILTLDGSGQLNLDFIIDFFRNLDFDADNLASSFWPLGRKNAVVVDPKRKFGNPVVGKSNIYPETFYQLYKGGEKPQFIAELYEVDLKEVMDAIEYCNAA